MASHKLYLIGFSPYLKYDIPDNVKIVYARSDMFDKLEGNFSKRTIKTPIDVFLSEIKKEIEKHSIAVVTDGDPLFYSIGSIIAENLDEYVEILPNFSFPQIVSARLKIPYDKVKVVSIHGRETFDLDDALQKREKYIAVYTDRYYDPSYIFKRLNRMEDGAYMAYVFERIGMDDEKTSAYYYPFPEDREFSYPNTVLLKKISDDPTYQIKTKGNLFTKYEIRTFVVKELGEGKILFDIGAGSGMVSMDSSRNFKRIFAIERDKEYFRILEENIKGKKLYKIYPIYGEAPKVLMDLPKPDAVFIGGSGGKLMDILDYLSNLGTIKIVANLVKLENIHQMESFFLKSGFQYTIYHFSISKMESSKEPKIFRSLNPIYVFSGVLNG